MQGQRGERRRHRGNFRRQRRAGGIACFGQRGGRQRGGRKRRPVVARTTPHVCRLRRRVQSGSHPTPNVHVNLLLALIRVSARLVQGADRRRGGWPRLAWSLQHLRTSANAGKRLAWSLQHLRNCNAASGPKSEDSTQEPALGAHLVVSEHVECGDRSRELASCIPPWVG